MARKQKDNLEQAIELALAPGGFISDRHSGRFVDDLEALRENVRPLIKKGEAVRAVALLEMFIAGCYEKSEEIDDSGGSFGQFVGELFCDWIRARQAAKAGAAETVRILLSWMDSDEYGYCSSLENGAATVLDRAGLAALEQAVRERADSTKKNSYAHRRQVDILKAIYQTRRDVVGYAALCEKEDGLAPLDCERLAEMSLQRRRPEDALAWVERGLDLEKEGHWPNRSAWRLPDLKRNILTKLGRIGDALESAWEDYRRAPSVYSYDDLMKFVPKTDRAEWHAKALGALDGRDLSSRVDLLVKTKETERLAADIEAASREKLVALSHYTSERAAKSLEKSHPLLAAKLQVAMALRIVEAKKSKYYDAALGSLEKARKLMLQEGHDDEWTALVGEVRESHRRKSGFMPGFERIAEGRTERQPSFRDRARKRWARGAGRGRETS